VYVQVEDLDAALAKAEKLGGKTILPPSQVPGGPKLAMFADPAGNVTGLLLGKRVG
jgi:predicted enzyme related to lactoylglutathione lyase